MKNIHLILYNKKSIDDLFSVFRCVAQGEYSVKISKLRGFLGGTDYMLERVANFGRLNVASKCTGSDFDLFFMYYRKDALLMDYSAYAHLFTNFTDNTVVLVGTYSPEMMDFISAWEGCGGKGILINESNNSYRIHSLLE